MKTTITKILIGASLLLTSSLSFAELINVGQRTDKVLVDEVTEVDTPVPFSSLFDFDDLTLEAVEAKAMKLQNEKQKNLHIVMSTSEAISANVSYAEGKPETDGNNLEVCRFISGGLSAGQSVTVTEYEAVVALYGSTRYDGAKIDDSGRVLGPGYTGQFYTRPFAARTNDLYNESFYQTKIVFSGGQNMFCVSQRPVTLGEIQKRFGERLKIQIRIENF